MKRKILVALAFAGFCGAIHANDIPADKATEITKCMVIYQAVNDPSFAIKPTSDQNQYVRDQLGPDHWNRVDKLARSYIDNKLINMVSNSIIDSGTHQGMAFGRALFLSMCIQTS